jgi:hypothetical protein
VVLRLIPLATSALLFCSCSPPTGTPTGTSPTAPGGSSPTPITCGSVSDLTVAPASDPEFHGYAVAQAGPVWLSAFGPVRTGKAVLPEFVLGGPTKVVIHPAAGAHPELQLRGVECATGQALHFCYNQSPCGFGGIPSSASELARRSDALITIPADQHTDDTGYMLFPRSGKYTILVDAGPQVLGTVTLQVG